MPSSFDRCSFATCSSCSQPVDHRVAVRDLVARTWVDNHFLGGLVHGQQLAQR